jgi:purine-binding chemotaxis protein CheW
MTNTFLSFTVYLELFAVNVSKVLEVLQNQHITQVPNVPDYIKGIINFRGEIVPLFEARIKFNLPEREDNKYVIIVLDLLDEGEPFRIGVIVDRVRDVISIDDSDIKPVPKMNGNFNTDFIKGIYKLNEGFIMLLDVEKVFSDDEIIMLKESTKEDLLIQNQ